MGGIYHADLNDLTRDDWKDPSNHLIGGQPDMSIVRSATYVVAASDAPAHVKAQADYKCSDYASDDLAIQAAYDAGGAGTYQLSQGTFILSTPVYPPSNSITRGMGRSTIIRDWGVYLQYGYPTGTRTNITLEDFVIDCNSVGSYGVLVRNASKFRIHNLEIKNTVVECIFCYSMAGDALQVTDFEISSNYLHAAPESAIRLSGTFPCARFLIRDNIIDSCCSANTTTRSSIEVDFATEGIIDSNIITNHLGHNTASASIRVYLIPSGGVSVTNNKSSSSLDMSYYINTCEGVLVSNNSSRSSAWGGFVSENSNHTQFMSNFSYRDKQGCISIGMGGDYDKYIQIMGNKIIEPSTYGIYSEYTGSLITNNWILNPGYGSETPTYPAIEVLSGATVCEGNMIYDLQTPATMKYGILMIDGATEISESFIKSNTITGATTAKYKTSGTECEFDQTIFATASLDLSGASTDIPIYHAVKQGFLAGYSILYTEASSGDAGVAVRIGRYQSGVALDDDYFDTSTSEVSKALGYNKHFVSGDLTQSAIALGDTITAGTAGSKTGTGEVRIILQIANG